ncbi:arginase family protein [Silvibacterium sp.]|uniref:arginase family protein n=1 Tax=Silvibacterium sp. TaxID=1964179 RepID=UPI0039E26E4D
MRRISVLSAPSNLGLKPPAPGVEPGVRELPQALLQRDLLSRLSASYIGEVSPPSYDQRPDPFTGVRNELAIRSYALEFAERMGSLLDSASFPLILGGDCSILLGSSLCLKRRGRFGLLFMDGHTDLLTPETSESGGVAGMDLAIVTGTGTDALTSIDGLKPYVRADDVVVFGFRWPQQQDPSPAHPKPPMLSLPLEAIRRRGIRAATEQALEYFGGRDFWLHLDVDVLDPRWMSAVDSPDPGGMSPEELTAVLKIVLASKQCIGMELTIYDPTLDCSGAGAELLVDLLDAGFMSSGS